MCCSSKQYLLMCMAPTFALKCCGRCSFAVAVLVHPHGMNLPAGAELCWEDPAHPVCV
jgi:hypothetical protein